MKICKCCSIEKPNSSFGLNKSKKDKLNIYCKACVREKTNTYKKKYPDQVKESIKKWKINNKISVKQYRKKYYKNNIIIEKNKPKNIEKKIKNK